MTKYIMKIVALLSVFLMSGCATNTTSAFPDSYDVDYVLANPDLFPLNLYSHDAVPPWDEYYLGQREQQIFSQEAGYISFPCGYYAEKNSESYRALGDLFENKKKCEDITFGSSEKISLRGKIFTEEENLGHKNLNITAKVFFCDNQVKKLTQDTKSSCFELFKVPLGFTAEKKTLISVEGFILSCHDEIGNSICWYDFFRETVMRDRVFLVSMNNT